MRRHILIAGLLVLAGWALEGANIMAGEVNAADAYARLKALAGDWEATSAMGKLHLNIQLIAGGTALVERETGEKMPEMMTVYHLDGDRLLLTHYCMAGNQPRMLARSYNSGTGEIQFEFLDATNLTSPGAGHMHNVKLRVIDHDHLSANWEFYENGQKSRDESFQYTRVQ